MFIFIQAIGIVAMIFPALSFQQKTQKRILLFQLIGNSLFFVQYLLLNSYVGAFLNLIAIIRALVYSQMGKRKWADSILWLYLFLLLTVATYVLTFTVFGTERTTFNYIVELMPVIGISIQHFGFRMKEASKVRLMYLFSAPLWVAYASIRMSIGGILVDSINIVSIIIGMIRLDRKKEVKTEIEEKSENQNDTK